MGFLLDGSPLVEARSLGAEFLMGGNIVPWAGGERYRMALRMGGAKVGKEAGEHLLEAGVEDDGTVRRILAFLDHCQVGRIQADETIRIWDIYSPFLLPLQMEYLQVERIFSLLFRILVVSLSLQCYRLEQEACLYS